MVLFLFVAAQAFSSRDQVPLATISLLLRRRIRKAERVGIRLPPGPTFNAAYPFFGICLLATSIHSSETTRYFWGLSALAAWALCASRPRRFSLAIWSATLIVAVALGYYGQGSLGRLRNYLETFNPQWLAGLARRSMDATQSRTALGQVGRIKTSGKIVIRLEPKEGSAPLLLREASYRHYRAQVWYTGNAKTDFENLSHETTNDLSWVLVRGKTNTATVNLACYLHGGKDLLPLPRGSGRLEKLPAYTLYKNSGGAVLAEGPGLVMFDARYGPGPTIDSPPGNTSDLLVPPSEEAALDEIISTFHLSSSSVSGQLRERRGRAETIVVSRDPAVNLDQTLRQLSAFFAQNFSYSMWQEPGRSVLTNETPLSRFLLRTRSGHCEYFATATVLLLRRLGIPARYAVGYAVHEKSGRKYVVRQRDAHAWCLVWNGRKNLWEEFDTTPASWVEAEAKQAGMLQFFSDVWSRILFEFSKVRWGQSQIREYVLWSLGPILFLLLYQIILRIRKRRVQGDRKSAGAATPWPGLDSEFYQLEKRLGERGLERQPSEALAHWLRRAAEEPTLAKIRLPLQDLLRLHYRYRFDPQGLTAAERTTLRTQAQESLAQL